MIPRWLVISMVAAVLLAACGSSPQGATTPQGDTAGQAGEAMTIQFLTIDDRDQLLAFEEMAKAFQKSDPKYANVKINFESVPFAQLFPKIETAVASGANLDMFLADGPDIKHYAFNKAIIPLQEYYTEAELKAWVPASVQEGSYKGTFMAPPLMQSCSMLFYNKKFTDAAGLNPPKEVEGWTIEEAHDAWRKTTEDTNGDGSPDVWGVRWGQGTYQGDYEHGILRRSAGKRGSNTFAGVGPDGLTFHGYIDTPEAIKAFEDYRSWHQGKDAVTPAEPIPEIFFGGKSAFYLSPDNAVGTINRQYPNGDFEYGVTGIPYYKDGAQLCHTGSWHVGVSPRTKNKDLSAAIAKFFAGPEGSKIWYDKVRQLPARVDLLNSLPEYNEYPQQLFADGLQTVGVPRIQTPGYTEYQQVFGELMQNVAQSQDADVKTLVEGAATRMEEALKKYEGWND